MRSTTFGDLLWHRAEHDPGGRAYTYLIDGAATEEAISYGDLLARARNLAEALAGDARPGDRAALLLDPGIDFVVALMACLLTGLVAVPAFPPPRSAQARRHPRLRAIWADASPSVVLTAGSSSSRHDRFDQPEPWADVPSIRVDAIGARGEPTWTGPAVDPREVALLQYTSGSAGKPKGVALSQHNLLANCAALTAKSRPQGDDVGVLWLPPYHDMGLVGGILQPLFAGVPGLGALYDVTPDWRPIFDRSALPGYYLACGTSGDCFKIGPTAGRIVAAIIDACEAGQDHDREPVGFVTPHQRRPVSLSYYSRHRAVAPTAPRNAIA